MRNFSLFVILLIVLLTIWSCGEPEHNNLLDPENPSNKGVLEKPATITTVNATAEQEGIRLTWAAVPKAIRYNVYRSEKRDGDYNKWVRESEKNEYFDTTVEKGKKYFYKVTTVYAVPKAKSTLEGSKKRAGIRGATPWKPMSEIEISKPPEPIIAGSSYKFSAQGFNADKREFVIQPSWSLAKYDGSDEDGNVLVIESSWELKKCVGAITGEGVFTPKKSGKVTIAAKVGNIAGTIDVTVGPGEATKLKIVSGDNQKGKVGGKLPEPLVVLVTDELDNPVVSGISIDFKVEQEPDGAETPNPSPNKITTGKTGRASAVLTLGRKLGEYKVKATFNGKDDPAVTFKALASEVGEPVKIVKRPPEDIITLSPGDKQPLEVTIFDQYDNPVEGSVVSFTPTPSGDASVSPPKVTADKNGKADTTLTAWKKKGDDYKVDVSANGLSTFFPVKVGTHTEMTMSQVPPIPPSSGIVGAPLSLPIKVKVKDKFDNPVKGVPISFTISQYPQGNPGKLSPASTETNTDGVASTNLTLGAKVGKYIIQATSPKVSNTVEFSIEAKHGAAEELLKFSGDGQTAQVTHALSSPLVVEVVDSYKNPVSGHKVQFEITSPHPDAKGQSLSSDDVAISGGGSLLMIETTTNTIIKTFDVGIFPRGVAVDGSYDDGDVVYVTIHSSSTVTLVDVLTGAVAKEAIPVDALPIGIAITRDGEKIYVANSGADSVSALEFMR